MIRLLAIAATMTAAAFGQTPPSDMGSPSPCPSGMVLNSVGRCECPAGTTMTSTGSCAPSNACPYTYNGRCVDVCPPDTLIYGNQCVLSCPAPMMAMPPYCVQSCPPYMMPVNGTCAEPTLDQMCQKHMPGSVASPAGDCVCPQGQWMVRDWNVTERLGSRCVPASMSSPAGSYIPPMACHTYIRNTTYIPLPLDTCQCVRELPVIVPNPADPFLPYACAPPNTQTPIKPCPPPTYFEFQKGQCMNATEPSPRPTVSPTATATATPTATASLSQRIMASPSASMTAKSSAGPNSGGGIASTPTATATQTPKVDDTVRPQITSESSSRPSVSATQTPQPTQRVIQEPSLSATQTPKDPVPSSDTTQRSPSATQTPKDDSSSGSGSDVSVSATQTPKPVDTTDPTDPNDTPKPSVSAEPTKRPEPSAEPTKRPTPPFTPRPTIPRESAPFTPRPTRRPLPTADVVWAADVTRKPLPSFEPTRMPPVRMTAMPSPWRPARNITISLEDRPPYIASQIKFPGANVTAFQRPEKIQEIQMTLACTLRLPLEKIRVTNITLTDARGIRTVIDAARFALSSNGTVGCYVVGSVGAASSGSDGRVSLRRLQAANSQAEVDYYIVEPPTEVLALTPTEFSAIVESSPALADLSASVGSSGVLALSEASLAVASAPGGSAPASTNGGAASVSNAAMIGGAVGGVAMATLVVAAVVGFTQMHKRNRIAQNITRSGSVHVVQHTVNPIGGNPVRLSPTQLQAFAVGGGSMRLPVAFEATKTRSGV
jgi:hypothetical protein